MKSFLKAGANPAFFYSINMMILIPRRRGPGVQPKEMIEWGCTKVYNKLYFTFCATGYKRRFNCSTNSFKNA